ncbi:hypothetical protein [Thermocatellispora tengchongensis]|uniref:hypothetical protein n=1 Tax=Thermocatellispora tengchongensis TaxID=1073253 RepID=UPI00362CBA2C
MLDDLVPVRAEHRAPFLGQDAAGSAEPQLVPFRPEFDAIPFKIVDQRADLHTAPFSSPESLLKMTIMCDIGI